ncbi:cysteine hydrolase family protein [Psychromarinibacter halotolerans]|uniref:Cysteine hydrolase family protein n=1 Tax=Psychromarinibacter halotolerans TaxID=1775175 RepID=A0ABV7GV59_9RHOB|nr:cysteine hydrolase family protein [Psychromarinibacter halotolerans]MDF0596287.1 cysteine hydrolase family protein [Psychromarinibacter halotolerans]
MPGIVPVPARPEPLTCDLSKTALIVIDMQHAYLSEGGYLDLVGFGVDGSGPVIDQVVRTIEAARAAGMLVIYMQNGFDPELTQAGPESSPVYHKSNPLKFMRANPDYRGKLITKGSWDYEFVDAIKPAPGEIVIHKSRYSAFCSTQLEAILRGRGITHLLVAGVNTNVCVESTIRDGFHKEFFCMMIADATLQAGDETIFYATCYNIEKFLGWVTSTDEVVAALGAAGAGGAA